jgi:hypothetical protein
LLKAIYRPIRAYISFRKRLFYLYLYFKYYKSNIINIKAYTFLKINIIIKS